MQRRGWFIIAVASLLTWGGQDAAAQTMIDMPAAPPITAATPAPATDGEETAATQPGADEDDGERTYTVGEIALTRYARARSAPAFSYGLNPAFNRYRRSYPPYSRYPYLPYGYQMRGYYPYYGYFPGWYGGYGYYGYGHHSFGYGFSGVSFRFGW